MHKKWLNRASTDRFEPYHPKYLGFEKALEKLRKSSSDHVKSVARIPLPHPVLSHIEKKYNLRWKGDSTRMLYVDLKANIEDYAVANDTESFEEL